MKHPSNQSRKRVIGRDEQGAAMVEFAFVLPTLIMFLWGIAQFGMIMAADAGIQNALGEGARLATIYPTPSTDTINTRMSDNLFGQFLGSYNVTNSGIQDVNKTSVDPATNQTVTKKIGQYIDLNITYTVTPNFIWFNGPVITMPRSKRVYINF